MANHNEDSTSERIGTLEANIGEIFRQLEDMKRARSEMNAYLTSALEKLDNRMRAVERYIWLGIGGLGALQVIIAILKR
jgi:regulator of replication initiation timing